MLFNRRGAKGVSCPRDPLFDGGCSVYEVGAFVFYLVAYMVWWEVKCPEIARVYRQWSCRMEKRLDKISIVFVGQSTVGASAIGFCVKL
jgi:hypothetical protein